MSGRPLIAVTSGEPAGIGPEICLRLIEFNSAAGNADLLILADRKLLAERGYVIDWHEYPMPHSVCLEEVQAIGRWLVQRMRSIVDRAG